MQPQAPWLSLITVFPTRFMHCWSRDQNSVYLVNTRPHSAQQGNHEGTASEYVRIGDVTLFAKDLKLGLRDVQVVSLITAFVCQRDENVIAEH